MMRVELSASIYIMHTYNTTVNTVTSLVNYRQQFLIYCRNVTLNMFDVMQRSQQH